MNPNILLHTHPYAKMIFVRAIEFPVNVLSSHHDTDDHGPLTVLMRPRFSKAFHSTGPWAGKSGRSSWRCTPVAMIVIIHAERMHVTETNEM